MQFAGPCDFEVTLFATIWAIRAEMAVSTDGIAEIVAIGSKTIGHAARFDSHRGQLAVFDQADRVS